MGLRGRKRGKNKNGYIFTGYYKDGMICADGDKDWYQPITFDSFILLDDLKNIT